MIVPVPDADAIDAATRGVERLLTGPVGWIAVTLLVLWMFLWAWSRRRRQ